MTFRLLRMVALLFAWIALVPVAHSEEGADATEYELKAVMLFNLARFVEWPQDAFANSNSPIIIGVLGNNPFGDSLDRVVQGESVNGRKVLIEHFETMSDLRTCHILYISSNEKARVNSVLTRLEGRATLSVSEIPGFTKMKGGMVLFYTNDQNKIRLRLNLESAKTERLTLSSKLIQVAELDKTGAVLPRDLRGSSVRSIASASKKSPAASAKQ